MKRARGCGVIRDKWIIDILADLRTFAQQNNLTRLQAELDCTIRTARDELADTAHISPPPGSTQRGGTNER